MTFTLSCGSRMHAGCCFIRLLCSANYIMKYIIIYNYISTKLMNLSSLFYLFVSLFKFIESFSI